jgi:hypothetical protein
MASPGTRATASACARSNRVTAATLARAMSRTSMSTDQAMGLALGGQAGARLAARLRLRRRASPLRRLVRAASIPHIPGRQVLGVDAWAWRRGHRYGTILVDLLPDRSAATIARQLGISRPTVDAYLRRDTPPGPRRFQWRPSARVLTPYLPY